MLIRKGLMVTFSEWLAIREERSDTMFPTTSPDRNPYMNGKWSTSAFATGKAKFKKNVVRDADADRKANTKQDGFHL
jgi:hypothetical protein